MGNWPDGQAIHRVRRRGRPPPYVQRHAALGKLWSGISVTHSSNRRPPQTDLYDSTRAL